MYLLMNMYKHICACVCAQLLQPGPTLCNPRDGNLAGSSVHGISQARILECVAILYSRGSSRHRDQTHVSFIVRWTFYYWATWEAIIGSSVQFSHSVVSDSLWPMDCSTPGFPVHHQLRELAQTHVHWVSDAIQPSHPLPPPSPPAFNLCQGQGLF